MGTGRTILRLGVGLAALTCLAVGGVRRHKVYEAGDEFGVLVFERISEAQLVEFATTSGVYAQEGRMVRHAWAAKRDGKQKCPT